MTVIGFIVFYNVLYLIGKSSFKIFLKNNIKLKTIDESSNLFGSYLFVFFGLFFIGNIAFLVNFFVSLKSVKMIFYFLIAFLLFKNLSSIRNLKISRDFQFSNLLLPGVLSISTFGSFFHNDSGEYHLNVQAWINEEPIVIGISNLTFAYGYQSIFEYISSFITIGQNFVFLHFLNVTFMTIFFDFLITNLKLKESHFLKYSSLFVIFFGILDNFGFDGGKNGFFVFQSINKFDTSFGIIFFITNILIFNGIKKNISSDLYIFIVSTFCLFAFQIKVFAIYLIPIIFFYLYMTKLNIFKFIKLIKYQILLLIFWMLKNIINTACLIYPIPFTCIKKLDWYTPGWSEYLVSLVRNFHVSYNLGQNFLDWFISWKSIGVNQTTMYNFLFSFLIILLIKKLFFLQKIEIRSINLIISIYVIFNIFIWILQSPEIRFGIGIFPLVISLIALNIEGFKFKKIKLLSNKTIIFILVFITSSLVVRLDSYKLFIENPTLFYNVQVPIVEYIDNGSYWNVIPKNETYKCWINIDCVPAFWGTERVKIGSYTKFTIIFDDNLYFLKN